jgi:hypothetical protein
MNTRDSNFELMRIVLIFMIICLHYLGHGGAIYNLTLSDFNFYPAYFIECLFLLAVNCFILITGYYQMNFKMKKLFNLWGQVFFYSVIISIIFWSLKFEPITIKQILKTFFPLIMGRWWFFSVYIFLYLLSPFINIVLGNINKKLHLRLLGTLLFFNVILTSLNSTFFNNSSCDIESFILLYCFGNYIRKYDFPHFNYILVYLLSSVVLLFGVIVFKSYNIPHIDRLFSYNFILIEISSICLFLSFKKIQIQSTQINKVASAVFGIYLISDHPYVRDFLYSNILFTQNYYFSTLFIPHLIVSAFLIFIVCLFIETARQKLFVLLKVDSIFTKIKKKKLLNISLVIG